MVCDPFSVTFICIIHTGHFSQSEQFDYVSSVIFNFQGFKRDGVYVVSSTESSSEEVGQRSSLIIQPSSLLSEYTAVVLKLHKQIYFNVLPSAFTRFLQLTVKHSTENWSKVVLNRSVRFICGTY